MARPTRAVTRLTRRRSWRSRSPVSRVDGWETEIARAFAEDPDGFARRMRSLEQAVYSVVADEIRRTHDDLSEEDLHRTLENSEVYDTRP
jgi:hypothetical protein